MRTFSIFAELMRGGRVSRRRIRGESGRLICVVAWILRYLDTMNRGAPVTRSQIHDQIEVKILCWKGPPPFIPVVVRMLY